MIGYTDHGVGALAPPPEPIWKCTYCETHCETVEADGERCESCKELFCSNCDDLLELNADCDHCQKDK